MTEVKRRATHAVMLGFLVGIGSAFCLGFNVGWAIILFALVRVLQEVIRRG